MPYIGLRFNIDLLRQKAAKDGNLDRKREYRSMEVAVSIRINRLYMRLKAAKGKLKAEGLKEDDRKFRDEYSKKRLAVWDKQKKKSAKSRMSLTGGRTNNAPNVFTGYTPSNNAVRGQNNGSSRHYSSRSNSRPASPERQRFENVPEDAQRFETTRANGERVNNAQDLREYLDSNRNRRHPMTRIPASERLGSRVIAPASPSTISRASRRSLRRSPSRSNMSSPTRSPPLRYRRSLTGRVPATNLQRDLDMVRAQTERIQEQMDMERQSGSNLPMREMSSSGRTIATREQPEVLPTRRTYSMRDLQGFLDGIFVITNLSLREAQSQVDWYNDRNFGRVSDVYGQNRRGARGDEARAWNGNGDGSFGGRDSRYRGSGSKGERGSKNYQ